MRRFCKTVSILLILALCFCVSLTLTACGNDKEYVLPRDCEVESVTMHMYESNSDFTFTGEELSTLVEHLINNGQMEKIPTEWGVDGYLTRYEATDTLTVTTKKQFLKKAKTYEIWIGRKVETDNKFTDKTSENYDTETISSNNYQKEMRGEFKEYIYGVINREQNVIAGKYYDAVYAALILEGYTITPITNSEYVKQVPDGASCAVRATKGTTGVNLYKFSSKSYADTYAKVNTGKRVHRIYYACFGDSAGYAIADAACASVEP